MLWISHTFHMTLRPSIHHVFVSPMKSATALSFTLLIPSIAFAADEIDFAHQVVPILQAHCKSCHMGEKMRGDFSMNTRESLLAGSENGVMLEPGKPGSRFIELLHSDDEDEQMPPEEKKRVPPQDIALLEKWIIQGAKWEPGFTFGEKAYEPPLKPRTPELPPGVDGRTHPVDRILDAHLAAKGATRPTPLDDGAFMRRLSLDLTGLLPEPTELAAFVKDASPDKRTKLIAATLGKDKQYTEHWISFWNDLLRNDYVGTGYIDGGRTAITAWLYQSLIDNKPYDQFARELLAPPTPASAGFINGIKWRGSVNASQEREVQFSQSISQTFLGLNMKCASCHDSFVDRWKLDEAYGLAAIVAERPLEIARCDVPTGRTAKAAWIFPELGDIDPAAPKAERLKQLAALMTHPENGRFTRTIANRLWHRLMGYGIVHPVDAMDTAPWSEDLLDHLGVRFAEDGYDLKKALAYIASSQAYQSQSITTTEGEKAARYRGPIAKRMTAEQFVDAVWSLTATAPAQPHPSVPKVASGSANTNPSALQAKWIWSYPTASASSPSNEKITLGTEFELTEIPANARAVYIADNDAVLYLNGMEISRTQGAPAAREIKLSGLKTGKNNLIVVATNGGDSANPAGFVFEAHVSFSNGNFMVIGSGSSWKWTSTIPDANGVFGSPPGNWQPAAELENPSVWDSFAASLRPGPAPSTASFIRAALVQADLLQRALGRPNREQIVSMRPDNLTTLEAIDLANGEMLADLLRRGAGHWAQSGKSSADLVEAIFLRALSRPPTTEEKSTLVAGMGENPSPQAIEDLLWMVLLLPEFQFVR